MESKERVVYLEDVQTTSQEARKEDSGAVAGSEPSTTTKTSLKRQRTLMDMFGSSQGSQSSQSSSKKVKIGVSGASVSSTRTVSTSSISTMKSLNSIPFSMTEFQQSLGEEQRNLLKLECEVMGKSWYVCLKNGVPREES